VNLIGQSRSSGECTVCSRLGDEVCGTLSISFVGVYGFPYLGRFNMRLFVFVGAIIVWTKSLFCLSVSCHT
jgi:hypothetical protein